MLALFNRLRALQFGLEGPFCASGFPESDSSTAAFGFSALSF